MKEFLVNNSNKIGDTQVVREKLDKLIAEAYGLNDAQIKLIREGGPT